MRWQTFYEARWIFVVEAILALASSLISPWATLPWVLIGVFTICFFRDPERAIPGDPLLVVAAADGVVSAIEEVDEPEVTGARMKRVAIFLSVFDVHVNRTPVSGEVIYSQRTVGKFLDARHPDATRLNEFRTWGFLMPNGVRIVVRQITGAIARRIVDWARTGDYLEKGERFGMIRFGSRTEIYLPLDAEILVHEKQRVMGGTTEIARLSAAES